MWGVGACVRNRGGETNTGGRSICRKEQICRKQQHVGIGGKYDNNLHMESLRLAIAMIALFSFPFVISGVVTAVFFLDLCYYSSAEWYVPYFLGKRQHNMYVGSE